MRPRVRAIEKIRVSGAFMESASQILSDTGSPKDVSTLVDMALKLRPLRMGRHLLGQELYKAAKSATSELVVREYPSFKLRKRKPHTPLPKRGYVAAAMKILGSPGTPRGYVDVREIARQARDLAILPAASPVPEYWMSVMLAGRSDTFSRSGHLALGLFDRGHGPKVIGPETRRLQLRPGPPALTEGIYERDIESLVAERLDLVEEGLRLAKRQYATPVGRIDLLCEDTHGNPVVVELKSFGGKTSEVVDQTTRYMGYIRTHVATRRQVVRGIIVVGKVDRNLAYAIVPIPNLELRTFQITIGTPGSFELPDDKYV